MRILFITSSRLGDAVLSTGILNYMIQTYPEARITVACGAIPVSIFEGFRSVERIIPIVKKTGNRHWIDFWLKVRGIEWDVVIDLRDSLVSRLLKSKKRYVLTGRIDKTKHKVEQMADVLGLTDVPSPRLIPSPSQKAKSLAYVPKPETILAIGPAANWIGKTWPSENFVALIKALTEKNAMFEKARIAIIAAKGEEHVAYSVLNALPEEKRIDLIAKEDPGTITAFLARCDLYIGNDSGLMHMAAAVCIPTIGLFGPSYPHLYAPWGNQCDYIQTPETYDELIDFEGYDPKTLDKSLMTSLSVEKVLSEVEDFCQDLKRIDRCR